MENKGLYLFATISWTITLTLNIVRLFDNYSTGRLLLVTLNLILVINYARLTYKAL